MGASQLTMDIASLTGSGPSPSGNAGTDKAFREADFLAIMLTEITNQDPFSPSETAKIVENMQKLQELANTNYDKFRNDLRWSQDLVGQSVTVTQANVAEDEAALLRERGINVDPGYGSVNGIVSGYRTVGESVWVTVDGKDYPIDNVQQIDPPGVDHGHVATVAEGFVGRTVRWFDAANGTFREGVVDGVQWGGDGQVELMVAGEPVNFDRISAITG